MEYVPEMRQELKGIASGEMSTLEDIIIKDFENPQKHKWREGYVILKEIVTYCKYILS